MQEDVLPLKTEFWGEICKLRNSFSEVQWQKCSEQITKTNLELLEEEWIEEEKTKGDTELWLEHY